MLDMDFTKFAFTCVACIAVLRMTEAGCKEDLAKDEDFKECESAYLVYMGSAASGGNSQDGTSLITLLCSEEGQAAISCLKTPLEDCPELKADGKFQMLGIIDQWGGCESAPFAGNCSAAMHECTDMSSAFGDSQTSTQFNMYQENVKKICGGVKGQFDCLKRHEKTCPNLENQFRQMMEQGRQQANPGTFLDFDAQKAFVMNECPKFPKDFTTSQCVKDSLMTSEFKKCYGDANQMNATAKQSQAMMSCKSYKATFPCVTKALESCGTAYQDAFTSISNLFMSELEEDCQLTSGSVNVRQMAFPTVVTLVFLFSKLVFV